uniref:Major facilitator superfamily (MFS) profile domain-containing protein n=1 Tax=Mantoniella antarctica TaxID=81844 RepID=A0A7S0S5Z4_9CHLO
MASVGVMSAAASKVAVFTGVRSSARGAARGVRTAAVPGGAAFPAKSQGRALATGPKRKAVLAIGSQKGAGFLSSSESLAVSARASVFAPEAVRGASVVVSAGGGAGPVDLVAEEVRFDMSKEGEKKRWSMIFALFCAFVLCNLDKVNMSVAIVPMAASFGWTSVEKGLVQSAFFWGYAFTQVPGGYLASKYGGKIVLFAGVMLWSFGTLIAPACANFSFTALLVSRFLVGLGEGVAPSAATGILAKGIPGSQRSKAVTATFGGLDVGSLSGLIIAPPIILFLGGWPAVFYLFGILGFIWGTWWFLCYMNDKSTDAIPTPEELAVEEARKAAGIKADPIPWGAFFTNKSFWALMAAHFTWNYFSYGLLAWLPSFLSSALNVTLTKSSFLSILPYLATVAMTLIVAPTADKLEKGGMARTNVRKLSQSLCFAGGAVALTGVAYVVNSTPPEAVTQGTVALVITLLSICFGLGAWVRTGLFCGHADLSVKYASIMLGVTNTLAAIASTLSTFFTGYFFSATGGNWALSLFIPIAVFQVISTVIFAVLWDSNPVDFDAIQKAKIVAA